MEDIRSVMSVDLTRLFQERGMKPLRLQWYADLRAAQNEILSPSHFADFRLFHAPLVFPFKEEVVAPKPVEVAAAQAVSLHELTRFMKPRPVVAAPAAQPAPQVPANDSQDYGFNVISFPVQAALSAAKLVAFIEEQRDMLAPKTPAPVVAAPAAAPADIIDIAAPRKTLSLKTTVDIAAPRTPEKIYTDVSRDEKQQIVAAAATEKPRKTLSLKTKVELPPVETLSRKSSGVDLAAAFKSEMKMVTEVIGSVAGAVHPDAIMAEKRKSPVSGKTWAEVLQEAEAYQQQPAAQKKFDIADAFKREMQALEKQGIVPASPKKNPGRAA